MELPKTGDLLLGKYLLERPLGKGGMGVVYAARHALLGQLVAVKFLLPEIITDADVVGRFLNEARAAARIENEHVARVLDVGTLEAGLPYMVLEYLDGTDLEQLLRKNGPLPVVDVVDYMLQAIEAVAHAHALGIVHRDLKPANLFLARRPDGTARVKVLDFGISKAIGEAPGAGGSITKTNSSLGSPLYMAPEQLRDAKSVDHRCDIWALGVAAYELLTGDVPFNGANAIALFLAIQETDPVSMRAHRPGGVIGSDLEAAVMRCLRRVPGERFSSVTDLGAALVPFGTAVGARAFENAKRILPLGDRADGMIPSSAGSSPRLGSTARSSDLPGLDDGDDDPDAEVSSTLPAMERIDSMPLPAITGDRSDAWPSAIVARKTRRPAVAVTIAGAGVLVALVVGGSLLWSAHRPVEKAPTQPVASSITSSNAVTQAASQDPSAIVSPIALPTASTTTAEPSASTMPQAKPSSAARALPMPTLTAGSAPRPKAMGSTAATPSASRDCTPPYEFDATGKKIWKIECLK